MSNGEEVVTSSETGTTATVTTVNTTNKGNTDLLDLATTTTTPAKTEKSSTVEPATPDPVPAEGTGYVHILHKPVNLKHHSYYLSEPKVEKPEKSSVKNIFKSCLPCMGRSKKFSPSS